LLDDLRGDSSMSEAKRIRETPSGIPTQAYLEERVRTGWRLVALEWERDNGAQHAQAKPLKSEIPFGLRLSDDAQRLEEDALEREALTVTLGLISADEPFARIVDTLNERGFRTRAGSAWTQAAVFDLLPRLIEVAPEILASEEWASTKRRILEAM
jgi:hypothetical protein